MDLKWTDRKNALYDLYEKCFPSKPEEADDVCLAEYILAVLRMFNGLSNMQDASLYSYEQRILLYPLLLFIDQFIEEAKTALEKTNSREKREYLNGLENSVVKVLEAYEHLVDGMANSDRRIFTGFAVDTNIYDLSPKLTAYYAYVLESITKLYKTDEKKDGKYAFLLHPGIRSDITCDPLFPKREKPGRVVVVNLPEFMMEAVPESTVSLIHEAFHYLPVDRKRQYRAELMADQVSLILQKLALYGINIDEKEADKMHQELFSAFTDYKKKLKEKNLYGWPLAADLTNIGKRIILNYHDEMMKYIAAHSSGNGYHRKLELSNREHFVWELLKHEQLIKDNCQEMLLKGYIGKSVRLLLEMYRETFCDVAMNVAVPLKAPLYIKTFSNLVLINAEAFPDYITAHRISMVLTAMENAADVNNEWKQLKEHLKKRVEDLLEEEEKSAEDTSPKSLGDLSPSLVLALREHLKRVKSQPHEETAQKSLDKTKADFVLEDFVFSIPSIHTNIVNYLQECINSLKSTLKNDTVEEGINCNVQVLIKDAVEVDGSEIVSIDRTRILEHIFSCQAYLNEIDQ